MDTSDLSERFFDENTVLYSASDRNKIVFDEAGEQKQQGKSTKNDASEAKADTDGKAEQKNEGNTDSDTEKLLKMWQEFKSQNPEGTLNEFYSTLANTNQEG
jgi:hypothetical protein